MARIDSRSTWSKNLCFVFVSVIISLCQTIFDGKLYELRITCGPDYPAVPPKVRFISRINLASVNQSTGIVEPSLPAFAQWNRNCTIESVLVGLKNSMLLPQNRRLPQPPEGSQF
jgi:ubiquitin-conjugating enzyme E2 variant